VADEGALWLRRELIGASAAMRALRAAIQDVAPLDTTVLLTGETGVGKGRVARALHRLSPRRDAAFVHADCASLAPTLIESELFGHERGAFTGAAARRVGRFEQAAAGTIFLDEIGELPFELQSRLLRVLQDREFERLGGGNALPMKARVIAATHRDLPGDVRTGRFRSDLYFRLCVFHLEIPALRSRREDIPALVRCGLARLAERLARPMLELDPRHIERLATCPWHGNVRELFNALERLAVRCRGRAVETPDLEAALQGVYRRVEAPALSASGPHSGVAPAVTPEQIAEALRDAQGNAARAARALGMARTTLRRRIERHALGALRRSAQAAPQHEAQRHQRERAGVLPDREARCAEDAEREEPRTRMGASRSAAESQPARRPGDQEHAGADQGSRKLGGE